ncbi:MAG: biopolymer transporter ExbD [Deltaproteobacteria bacterium]|nr:biopolymer transporter ExbD [Deltaproteobacteria bacterium]
MKIHQHGHGTTALSEINIVPLVDVILVLLIIFMVTAPLLQQGIDIDLPEVNAAAVAATQEDFVLSIDNNGKILLGDDKAHPYSLQNVEEKLVAIFENKEKKELYLRADKGIEYGYVVAVMAACQKAGVERIGMISMPEVAKKK